MRRTKLIKNEIIYCLITIILIFCCLGLAYRGHRLYANEQNLLQTYINQLIPEIVCIGDSLTKGTGGEGVSYPNYLREILWDNSIYIPTTNLGKR